MKKLIAILLLITIAKAEIFVISLELEINEDFTSKVSLLLTSENVSSLVIKLDKALKVESDVCKLENSIIKCIFPTLERKSYYLNITTDKLIQENLFYFSFSSDQNIKKLLLTIILPEGFILNQSLEELVPKPKTATDGKRIYLIYEFQNFQSAAISFNIKQAQKIIPQNISIIIVVIIIAVAIISGIFAYFKIFSKRKFEELILLLNENERKILNILIKNPNTNQKKIVELSGLSKAEVSKILSSFKNRGIVEIEKRGRNNIVKLKKNFKL
ncbi:MAG: winged helix-turn-helix transcriptional regulator [Candidatus Aenigmatarchaeota archaeon]